MKGDSIKTVSFLCLCGALSCQAPRSRSTPPGPQAVPDWPRLVEHLPALDTSRVVTVSDSLHVFRTDISLTFKPTVADSAKAAFFARHFLRVIGVTSAGRFFVRIPDPGPNPEALLQIIAKLREEQEVARAGWILRDPLPTVLDDR